MRATQYRDKRTGEIVSQIPLSEIEHFEEYHEPAGEPVEPHQLATELRQIARDWEPVGEAMGAELATLRNAAELCEATDRARDAASADSAAVLFGYAKAMGFDADDGVGGYIRVFFENHYISGGPGFVGRVAIILFDGGDDPAVTMRWDKDAGEWVLWS